MDLLVYPLLLWIVNNPWKTGAMVVVIAVIAFVVIFLREIGKVSEAADKAMRLRQEAEE